MLRKIPGLFKRSSKVIDIYIDELRDRSVDTSSDSIIKSFHDQHDACMRAVITSFSIISDEVTHKTHVVFALPDTNSHVIRLHSKQVIAPEDTQKDFLLAKCAAESLLRKLFAHNLMLNEKVSFTATRGNSSNERFNIYTAQLHMKNHPDLNSFVISDTVDYVHAHLDKRELHISFNKMQYVLFANIVAIFAACAKHEGQPAELSTDGPALK